MDDLIAPYRAKPNQLIFYHNLSVLPLNDIRSISPHLLFKYNYLRILLSLYNYTNSIYKYTVTLKNSENRLVPYRAKVHFSPIIEEYSLRQYDISSLLSHCLFFKYNRLHNIIEHYSFSIRKKFHTARLKFLRYSLAPYRAKVHLTILGGLYG